MNSIFNLSKIFIFFSILAQINSEEISISLNDISTDISNDNYSINNKILTISKKGDYKISDSWSECQIVVDKKLEVKITLSSIEIDNSNTGPFIIKKNTVVNLILEGNSKITDKENIENKSSTDEIIADAFEGASMKFKSSSSLSISGTGALIINGNTKNGIKGAAQSTLTINDGILIINAEKNALACDNYLIINGGKITVISQGDGIKAEPDKDDDVSLGTIEINGGEIKIESQSDAIQAG